MRRPAVAGLALVIGFPVLAGTVSIGNATLTASGSAGSDNQSAPAYTSNPNDFNFQLTDGVTTVTGQERRNNDPAGGPNTAFNNLGFFDGKNIVITGTINSANLSPAARGFFIDPTE